MLRKNFDDIFSLFGIQYTYVTDRWTDAYRAEPDR